MSARWTLSIRAGLVLLALLAVLPALALQVYDGAVRRRHLVEDATHEVLRAADALAQIQARITDSTRLLLSTLTVMPQVRERRVADCDALFSSLRENNPIYTNILAVDRDSNLFASAVPHGPVSLADRAHFRNAMASGAFAAGEYIVSRTTETPAFPFAQPFRDASGDIVGVVIAAVELSAFDAVFDRFRLPEGSILGITDHRGLRLHYRPVSDANPVGKPIRPEVWQAIARGGDSGVALLAGSDGFKRYYAWSKARLTPESPPYMVFVVGLPESAVLGSAKKALVQNVVLLIGVAALALGVAWFVGGAVIARRLDRIADTADRIGRGELSARTGLPHGEAGIGKVARTIDAMAGLLAGHDAARERALIALRQSQERMGHIAATMADLLWETDVDDRFTHVSLRARQILGYDPNELTGQTLFDHLAPGEAQRVEPLFAAAKTKRAPLRDLECWYVTRDGQRRCLMASAVPWHDETGAFRGYRGVSRDVTDRVLASREILDSLRDKEILLKEIHHRVKNNLQIISGLLYLQEEQVHDPGALEAFRESRNRIASMALVHEELYRSTNLSRVCLGEYVRDLLPRLFGNGDMPPRITRELRLAEVRVPIEQAVPTGLIINELLTNAYKHGFAGRETGLLTIAVAEGDGLIEIEVRDDGPGLPEGLVLERTSSLGMQLVCNLTRQLRGEITARNDGGAVFTLRFQRAS